MIRIKMKTCSRLGRISSNFGNLAIYLFVSLTFLARKLKLVTKQDGAY